MHEIAIVLLAAAGLDSLRANPPRWLRWLPPLQFALCLIGGVAAVLVDSASGARGHLVAIDWSYWPVLAIAGTALIAGQALSAVEAWRGRIVSALAWPGALTAAATMLLAPLIMDVRPDFDARRLAGIVARSSTPDDVIMSSTRCVQDFSIVATVGRRLAYYGKTRELGMGHASQVAPADAPMPAKPYEVSGDNCVHPWLYSHERLLRTWAGSQRVWLFTSDAVVRDLNKTGLMVHEIARTRDVVLVTNVSPAGFATQP